MRHNRILSQRQLILDMIEGSASCDYPPTNIRKRDPMPMHPCFCKLLPLTVALYGRKSKLACHHPTRAVAFVPFTTGVSQGDGTGSGSSSLEPHFAGTETLSQYPNVPAQTLAIMDDFHLIATLKHWGPIFITSRAILLTCIGVETISPNPVSTYCKPQPSSIPGRMRLVYEQSPILAELPLVTDGFICVGTLIGPILYIH
jgi:hypothetical protein